MHDLYTDHWDSLAGSRCRAHFTLHRCPPAVALNSGRTCAAAATTIAAAAAVAAAAATAPARGRVFSAVCYAASTAFGIIRALRLHQLLLLLRHDGLGVLPKFVGHNTVAVRLDHNYRDHQVWRRLICIGRQVTEP